MKTPDRLWFTEKDDANRLLAEDPFALLVGFALDQQITVQQAFQGPLRIKLAARHARPEEAREDRPRASRSERSLRWYRFPGTMAGARARPRGIRHRRIRRRCIARLGGTRRDGADLKKRLAALPGFGDMKVRSMTAVLAKRFGVAVAKEVVTGPPHARRRRLG